MILFFSRHPGQIDVPFHWKKLLLLIVTFLAAGDDIALGAFAAPRDGYDVIHGERLGRN